VSEYLFIIYNLFGSLLRQISVWQSVYGTMGSQWYEFAALKKAFWGADAPGKWGFTWSWCTW
jgi:hypothetical protein